jgi:hypothetical protein
LGKPVQVNRFRTFARNRQNGFVALGNCFRMASSAGQWARGRVAQTVRKALKKLKKKPPFRLEHDWF